MQKLSCEIQVRFADLDAYGHVNNAIIFSYLEAARTMTLMDAFVEFMNKGITFLVVHASCDYKKPIQITDKVIIDMELKSKGKTSFEIHYNINNGKNMIFAIAKTVMVTFDSNEQKPIKTPDKILEFFMNNKKS